MAARKRSKFEPRADDRFSWVASPGWNGRRWEIQARGIPMGRVVMFVDGEAQASWYWPKYLPVGKSYGSLEEAAEALVADCRKGKKA